VYDFINGLFGLGGVFFCLGHIKQIKEDKDVAGVYVPAVAFFSLWGYWNILYYSNLDQWSSFTAGILLACTNTYWAYLSYKYKNNEKSGRRI